MKNISQTGLNYIAVNMSIFGVQLKGLGQAMEQKSFKDKAFGFTGKEYDSAQVFQLDAFPHE